jgi:hypothetical protein
MIVEEFGLGVPTPFRATRVPVLRNAFEAFNMADEQGGLERSSPKGRKIRVVLLSFSFEGGNPASPLAYEGTWLRSELFEFVRKTS